jgi:O-antigen/teichoic acid export membrane protein
MLRFSTPLIAFTASQYVIQAIDLIIVRAFKSTAQVGVYAFAYQVFTTLQALATVAPQVLTPLFVSARTAHSEALVRRYFERVVPQALFVGSVGAGLVIPILPFVVPALFGSGFKGSVEPLAVLLIGLVLLLLSNLLAPVVVLHERSRPVAALNTVGAVVNVGADVLLLGPLHAGIVAAAAATTACFLVIGVGYFVVARRCLGLSTRVPAELMAPAIGALVPTVVLDGPQGSIVGISLALAATAALLASRGVFAREDADLIERLNMPVAARRALLRGLAVVAR